MKAWNRPRYACAAACALFGLAAAAGSARGADDSSEPLNAERRWIPSASLYSTGFAQGRSAEMESDTSPYKDGDSIGLLWSIGGTADIATPVVLDVTGRPRLFAHADVGYLYSLEDPVTTEGDPGSQPELNAGSTTAQAISGVGSSVRAEGKSLVYSGGLGSVFSFEAFDRGFRFRPTLEWLYQRDTIKSTLGGGESESTTPGSDSCNPACRTLFVKAQTEKGYHSLGPGFELEADVGRAGDFLVGFYGSFRAYYIVSDRKANMRNRGSWERTDSQPTTRPDTEFITQYEREPWHYRFGMGLRILWSPEE